MNISESLKILNSILPEENEEDLQKIAANLCGYPYGIVQFAMTLKSSPTKSVKAYLRSIQDESDNMKLLVIDTVAAEQVEKIGINVISNDILELKKQDPEVFDVLAIISLMGSKKLAFDLLKGCFDNVHKFEMAIKKLVDRSLLYNVTKDSDFITYDVHDVTQKIVYSMLSEEEKENYVAKCAKGLLAFFSTRLQEICDVNREDQVFYNHVISIIRKYDYKNPPKHLLPLLVFALKRPLYSRRSVAKALRDAKIIAKMEPEKYSLDNQIKFEYLADHAFIQCIHNADTIEDFNSGIESAQKALKLAREMKSVPNTFKALTRLIWIPLYQGTSEHAKQHIHEAEGLINQIDDKYLLKEFYFGVSWYFIEEGDFNKSLPYANKGLEIESSTKNANVGLYLYINKGICLFRHEKYKECLEIIDEGLKREREVFTKEKSLAKGELKQIQAMALLKLNALDEACIAINESIKVFDDILGVDSKYQPKAVSLKVAGEIFYQKNDIPNSIKSLELSFDMFKDLTPNGGSYAFSEMLCNLAIAYINSGETDKAINVKKELYKRFGGNHESYLCLVKHLMSINHEWMI